MQAIWHDLRYGLRGIRNQPGFSVLAMVTLALGIGASTTIFSVIQNVLLDPFPYTDARRVASIVIHDVKSARPGGPSAFPVPEFLEYQNQNHVFEEVIGGGGEDVLQTTDNGTEQYTGGYVTPNMFRFLGVPPLLGRGITLGDGKPGAPPVFVMSYKMWRSRYDLDPSVLGRTFVLNGQPTTLVGIMPRRFTKLGADLWRPVALDRADPQTSRRFFLLQARLKPGVTLQQAAADVELIARRLAQTYPHNYPKQFSVMVVSWIDSLVGQFRKTLYTLAAAVALLLLIACNNVANMLLARAAVREKEMAVRASLGARRSRLIRQLLVESLLLAVGGAALGCLVAYLGIKGLVPLIPEGLIPREAVIQLNVPVLLFSLAVAAATAVLFGLVPALLTAKRDIAGALKDSGKGVSGGFRRGKLREVLVVAEVALSLVLLVGAGLLMRSFVKLQSVDLGLDPENILVARLPLPRGVYQTAAAKQRFFGQLLPRLHALPGVVAATETSTLPPYGGIRSDIEIIGKSHPDKWEAIFQLCSEGYFPTLRLRLLRGRTLTAVDVNGARRVAVVNQTLVNRYFGQEDPLGRQVKVTLLETFPDGKVDNPVFEIVGVTSDSRNQGIQDPPLPELFIPYTITGAFERGILVRTAGEPKALLNTVRQEIWSVDRGVALTMTGSLVDFMKQISYAEPRFSLILLGVFAAAGLLLVAIGVYSVMAYTVSRQAHEIGIRMALGAGRGDVMRLVLRLGLRLVGVGVLIGIAASLGAGRIIASQLWGVSPHDPAALAAVVGVMVLAGAAACYIPARRALKVDPIVALRSE
jgi:putative ABC transport system permease protein